MFEFNGLYLHETLPSDDTDPPVARSDTIQRKVYKLSGKPLTENGSGRFPTDLQANSYGREAVRPTAGSSHAPAAALRGVPASIVPARRDVHAPPAHVPSAASPEAGEPATTTSPDLRVPPHPGRQARSLEHGSPIVPPVHPVRERTSGGTVTLTLPGFCCKLRRASAAGTNVEPDAWLA